MTVVGAEYFLAPENETHSAAPFPTNLRSVTLRQAGRFAARNVAAQRNWRVAIRLLPECGILGLRWPAAKRKSGALMTSSVSTPLLASFTHESSQHEGSSKCRDAYMASCPERAFQSLEENFLKHFESASNMGLHWSWPNGYACPKMELCLAYWLRY